MSRHLDNGARELSPRWWAVALGLVLLVAAGLRYGTNVLDKGPVFDEGWTRVPVENLLRHGWSVETAIDFVETKGPTFVWLYAAGGMLLGESLDALRLVSVVLFAGGAVPLLLIAGRGGRRGAALPIVTAFYVLLPHNAPLGQLLMSEPSFIFGALWLLWAFLWGFGEERGTGHPVAGPVLFGVLLAILLHLRVHAVAFAAAAVLVALERDRLRSWPWWVACALAGLSRVPLWIRWGGLVSPEIQTAHGLGFGPEGVTYLAAALVPVAAIFLWPVLADPDHRPHRWMVWTGAGAGLLLVLAAQPDLSQRLDHFDGPVLRFLGAVATAHRVFSRYVPPLLSQAVLLGALPVAGLAALGALAALSWRRPVEDGLGAIGRLAFWTLLAGCALYGLTRGAVYDRYLLPWAVLLPVLWTAQLPRRAQVVEALVLAAMCAWFTWRLLIRMPAA